jgi:hypothetical protein
MFAIPEKNSQGIFFLVLSDSHDNKRSTVINSMGKYEG